MTVFNSSNFIKRFPIIEIDDSFYMRDMRYKDAEQLHAMMSNDDVLRFLSERNYIKDPESAKNTIDSHSYSFRILYGVYWAIVEKKEDKLIGTIGYNQWSTHHRHAELSYELIPSWWGRGIMSKAIATALKFGFENMNLNRIEAKSMTENVISHHLLYKAGFQKECIMRQYYIIRGEFKDIILFGLLKDDFLNCQ